MRLKNILLLVILQSGFIQASAGLQWIDIGINGLTCSLCSRSVEMSIRKLDFVDSVSMSLESTEGRVFFRKDTPVNFNQLVKAVVNAGFSIRSFKLQLDFTDIHVRKDGHFTFQGQLYEWLDYADNAKKQVGLKLVDENFLPKKESAAWKKKLTPKASNENVKVLHVVQHG